MATMIEVPVEDYHDARMFAGIRPAKAINPSGIQPLDLRVLVLRDSVEKKTAGGIILPETESDKRKFAMQKATIVAVGENAWEEAASRSAAFRKPQAGDRVLINKYGGVDIVGLDGETYVLMSDDDVIGRLEE